MKKTLLNFFLLGFIGLNSDSFAQPTLTASGCNPVIGNTYTAISNGGFPQGAAGANQTWNFTSIGNTGSSSSQIVAVNSTPNGALFTNSNIASSSGGAYVYYSSSANALTINGVASPSGGPLITYSNGEDFLRYPLTFGNTYTDTWAATFTSGVDFFRTGSVTVTADGYGTIITPQGTFTNALRIHFVETYHDSSDFAVGDYTNDQYFWYKDGITEALASTYTFTSTFAGQTNTTTGGTYASGTVGIEESQLSSSIALFPNPAQETINLTIDDENISNAKVKIINQLGQDVTPVEIININAGNNTQIDVAYLKNGIYSIQILLQDNSIINKRFTVNK
jgi:hypothetical protein